MAPSYEQNTAKIGEIHGTVNLGFKRPVHEGYMVAQIRGVCHGTGGTAFSNQFCIGVGNPCASICCMLFCRIMCGRRGYYPGTCNGMRRGRRIFHLSCRICCTLLNILLNAWASGQANIRSVGATFGVQSRNRSAWTGTHKRFASLICVLGSVRLCTAILCAGILGMA